MKNATAVSAVQSITSAKPDAEVRICRRLSIGQALHQGDVYLHRVADDWPRGAKLGTRQVAVGTTIGSRHVAEGEDAEVFAGSKLPGTVKPHSDVPESAYLGPVVVAPSGFTLTHPEHAHHVCPAGVYQVTYQVDPIAQRRVQD